MINHHTSNVKGLAISDTREMLISGSFDKLVCFYNLQKKKLIKSEEKHSDYVRTLDITFDEKYVISAGDDSVLIVWDLETLEVSFKLEGHSDYINHLVISTDNDIVYSGSEDNSIMKWSLKQKKALKFVRSKSADVYCIALTRDGSRAYVGTSYYTINAFDIQSRNEIACIPGHTDSIFDITLSFDETLLLTASNDRTIRVFKTDSFEEVAVLANGHSKSIKSICITKDKKQIISCGNDCLIVFWILETKKKEFVLEGHRKAIEFIRLTNEDKYLISASSDELIKLWDMKSKSLLHSFIGHNERVRILAVFESKSRFVSGAFNGLIKVWSIQDKREEYSLQGHSKCVLAIQLTSDEQRLITASEDTKIIIWDLNQRAIELCFSNNNLCAYDAKITMDGRFLLTAVEDKTLKVWKMHENLEKKIAADYIKPNVQINTPDGKFELTYINGSVSKVTDKNSIVEKIPLGRNHVYDTYYQNLMKFYNFIDKICEDDIDNLMDGISNVVFSRYSYTILHILAIEGNSKVMERVVEESECLLKTDYFGKSPLFYSLNKGHQNCVVLLIDLLIKISASNDKTKIHSSLASITEELPIIILNSSKRLDLLLKNCLISTEQAFIPFSKALPVYHFNSNFLPATSEFTENQTSAVKETQVKMKYTPFPFACQVGTEDCIEIFDAVINCSNSKIYKTDIVKYVLQIHWNELIYWVFGYTFLLWVNLILLVLLFSYDDITETWILPVFLLVNFFLILWESIQMCIEGLIEYFKDAWNIVDFLRFIASMAWVWVNIFENKQNLQYRILTWSVALLNFTRGLTGFRVFDGTRYYVKLILRALSDMGYFIVMLSYSTITFGVMFQVSRNHDPLEFKTLWMDSYSLNFGNFEAQENYKFSFETLAYMLATVINVILMLNLLISILGDSYSNFQTEREFIDYSEKASILMEIQKMLFWVKNNRKKQYLHVLCSFTADDDEEEIDSKIENIEIGLGNIQELVKNQTLMAKDELGIQIQRMDSKLHHVEEKVLSFEQKFSELSKTMVKILEYVKPKEENKED